MHLLLFLVSSAIYLTIFLYAHFHIHTELLEKNLPTLDDQKEIRKNLSLFLPIPSCPKLWVWHTGEKIGNCDMAMILDEAFALLLLETGKLLEELVN